MHSTHQNQVLFGIKAQTFNQANTVVLMIQVLMMMILMFSDKMINYSVYTFLDMLMLIPLMNCFCTFTKYAKEDLPRNRKCIPIACCIMVVVTGAFFFQCICMMLKQAGRFDIADKTKALVVPKQAEKSRKSSSSSSSHYGSNSHNSQSSSNSKTKEKANNDIVDQEDDEWLNLAIYIFLELIFIVYWCISYTIMNAYVQKSLPSDLRQQPTNWPSFIRRNIVDLEEPIRVAPRVSSSQQTPIQRVLEQNRVKREQQEQAQRNRERQAQEEQKYVGINVSTQDDNSIDSIEGEDDASMAKKLQEQYDREMEGGASTNMQSLEIEQNEQMLSSGSSDETDDERKQRVLREARLEAMNRRSNQS